MRKSTAHFHVHFESIGGNRCVTRREHSARLWWILAEGCSSGEKGPVLTPENHIYTALFEVKIAGAPLI